MREGTAPMRAATTHAQSTSPRLPTDSSERVPKSHERFARASKRRRLSCVGCAHYNIISSALSFGGHRLLKMSTERVSHDRRMRSAFHALEVVGITPGTARRGLDARHGR